MKHLNIVLPLSLMLAGCVTSLANRTPLDIASDSVRRTDPISGISEITAPQVDALGSRRAPVVGKALLRTAGPFTDDKGVVLEGGAYMDIVLTYSTETPYPEETRFYNQLRWPDGEPALLAGYDAAVLDCREDIYTTSYDRPRRQPRYGYDIYGKRHKHHDKHDEHQDHEDERSGGVKPPKAPDATLKKKRPRYPHKPQNVGKVPLKPPAATLQKPSANPDKSDQGHLHISPKTTKPVKRNPVIPSNLPRREITARPLPATQPVKAPPRTKPIKKQSKPNIDRVFRRTDNPQTSSKDIIEEPGHNYDQQYSYAPVYEQYTIRTTCRRVESIRVFVPRERLAAATPEGLVLYVRPRTGRSETIVLPINYIEGFRLAAFSPEGESLTLTGPALRLNKP